MALRAEDTIALGSAVSCGFELFGFLCESSFFDGGFELLAVDWLLGWAFKGLVD